MKLRSAIIIATIVSFVSISMEILWMSVIGYVMKGKSGVFALVLSLVLFGIAFGAKFGNILISKNEKNITLIISKCLFLAGILNFAGFPLTGHLMTLHESFFIFLLIIVSIVSFLLGCIFPLLCHISIPPKVELIGKYTSWIYAGTILGATAGPLLTGFVLLDHFSTPTIVTILCIICLVISLIIYLKTKSKILSNKTMTYFSIGTMVFMIFTSDILYADYFEIFHFGTEYSEKTKFTQMWHGKNGIITIVGDESGDIVYGNGIYDGRVQVDIENDSNGIQRACMTAALHPEPRDVLMIGLSTGAWAKMLSNYEKINTLTIIEINPQYINAIKEYPEIASILKDEKIKIHIDDGRRWLHHNPDKKFDMIIMNTTFYWREHSTNLLSKEFLEKCKSALNIGGVVYWNTTGLRDNIYTGANVYEHIVTYRNFVAASDTPFAIPKSSIRENLLSFKIDNTPLFKKNKNTRTILEKLVNTPLIDVRESILKENLWLITDDNIASEYKVDNIFSNFFYGKKY
ncbi:spermidine synthase [Aquimarina sp. RZ0]|uniref:spermine/spermidine synthase domain-containing protein n=1 Tax=Aquimarina sp. RZ0 TaxID=2607730 RepID=UPI0011F28E5A|nr:spermidine synthase [Aquimarina sp. RZ0]KAA1246739.1 spermidine synthase [Aquimarina sp. RZ0]